MPSALIFGATGQTGRHLLRELIECPKFTRVCEVGRRVTPAEDLPAQASGKLDQKVIDFERLEEVGLREGQWDVVFIVMGTTARNAGSRENFTRIDREYVVNAAKAAKADKDQRLIYLSGPTADPQSYIFFSRSKGLTEQELAELGYKDTIMFRPAALAKTNRSETRLLNSAFLAVTGVLSRFSSSLQIEVDRLGKSMRVAGERGSSALPFGVQAPQTNWGGRNFAVINNSNALALSQ